ncbi:NADP-dependent oxidoreductase domain-containing protein [Ochromonadaceae sp. CCMP2298]|nr:NADP-dependent oxidoreductase domain-containing protein [Ochromonadaceae sp. CCMP2298]
MESVKPVKLLQAGMRYRSIPNSELVVSELCLGTMNFGDQLTKKTSHALLDAATQEYAINFIDTAESYPIPSAPSSHGKSERIIGEWLKGKGSSTRQQLVISTKVCGFSDEMNWVRNSAGGSGGSKGGTRLNKKQIVEAVDAQLTRLGTDYIDLLHFHWPDRYVPLNGAHYSHDLEREAVSLVEQLEAVGELVKAGKVRSFGLSNETPYGVASFVKTAELVGGLPRPVSLQNAYNLLEQNEFRMGLSEACAPLNGNLAVLAHSPLAGGALTGKYLDLDNTPQDARMRKYVGYMYRYVAAPAQAAVKDFSKVAASYDLPLGAVALAWVASQKVTSTVIGASSLGQLQEQVQALNLAPLGAELAQALAECSLQHLDPTKGRFDIIDPNLGGCTYSIYCI